MKTQKTKLKKFLFIIFSLLIVVYIKNAPPTLSVTIEELKSQIKEKNQQIENIEAEIKKLQEQIEKNAALANNLKNQIGQLNLQKQKIQNDINLTQKKIDASKLTIQELDIQINEKKKDIENRLTSLEETLRKIKEVENNSLIEIILSKNNFSDFFNSIDKTEIFQNQVITNLNKLKELKKSLEEEQEKQIKEKENLEKYKSQLSDKHKILDVTQKTKNQLLAQTKNMQTNYNKLLSEKIKLRKQLEKEIDEIEAKIKIYIDPSNIPKAGSGILSWPFNNEKMNYCKNYKEELGNIFCITQYFGATPFATANPQVYKSGEHKGLDFRAPVGTEILAAESGIVAGVGDTDITCPNASYGKWIMINHNNGLSTVYGHLSYIKVVKGQTVKRGELIGYSGNTGYSTGPHLHFEVRLTVGTQISTRESTVCRGKIYVIPLSSIDSYLNPLSYL